MVHKKFIEIVEHITKGIAIPKCYVDDIVRLNFDFGKNAPITNITFNKTVIIEFPSTDHDITFITCIFNAPFYFQGKCNLKDFGFFDCKFNSSVSIDNVSAVKFEIAECFLKRGLHSHSLSAETLRLELLTSESSKFNFFKPHLSNCFISKIKDGSEFMFSSFDEKTTQDDTSFITALSIRNEPDFTGEVLFHSLLINTISLSGYNKSGRINFQSVTVGSVNCQHFTNLGFMSVYSLKVQLPAIMYLYNSSFGKCEIFDINFKLFNSIVISNSGIQEILATNIVWCEEVQANVIESTNSLTLTHQRESYRQLKNIMIRNNDKVEELKYHALEMDTYHKYLKNKRGNFEEKFIIQTNKLSNNHGLSWGRAILWILGISIVIFNLNKILLGYNSFDINLFWKDIANWILSINPVRKFNDVYTEYRTGWQSNLAFFLDVFVRIIYSYLIFQFISAFRKYVKK